MASLGFDTSPPLTEGMVKLEDVIPGAQPLATKVPTNRKEVKSLTISILPPVLSESSLS